MSTSEPPPLSQEVPSRAQRLRALVVLQVKLWVEATRDVLLSPLLLLLGLGALIRQHPFHGWFLRVMALARRSEDFLDVFGRSRSTAVASDPSPTPTFDDLVDLLERQLSAQAGRLDREALKRRLQAAIDGAVRARTDADPKPNP